MRRIRTPVEGLTGMEQLAEFLLWCTVVNSVLLIFWGILFVVARRWMFAVHTRWFALSEESFGRIHYTGMLFYKVGVLLFNLVPYVVVRFLVM